MAQRLQTINGDTVLEITQSTASKRRLSQNALLRRKTYLEQSIAHFQAALTKVNADLSTLTTAKDAQATTKATAE